MARNRQPIPESDLRLTLGGEDFLGGNRLALLQRIADTGSITRAGRAVGISYRTAWDAVDRLNALADEPLVESSAGGRRGGGTRLTAHGKEILALYEAYRAEHRRFLAGLQRSAGDFGKLQLLARKVSLKVSARNQIWGKVESIRKLPLKARIELRLGEQGRLRAEITRTGLEALGLRPGDDAYALIKANWVALSRGPEGAKSADRNSIRGTVSAVDRGKGRFEATLEAADGFSVTASGVERSGANWKVGDAAYAVFAAADVILGVPS